MGMERPFRPAPALTGVEIAEFAQKQKIAVAGKHETIDPEKRVVNND
jgi:hypothetical protein